LQQNDRTYEKYSDPAVLCLLHHSLDAMFHVTDVTVTFITYIFNLLQRISQMLGLIQCTLV